MKFNEPPSEKYPPWQNHAMGFLSAAESGLKNGEVTEAEIESKVGKLVFDLITGHAVDNLGELQSYLRRGESVAQLAARPFSTEDPAEIATCTDPLTGEPRAHFLSIEVGYTNNEPQIRAALRELGVSDEVNEATLAHDTGLLHTR